jgi:dipeptidyl-peptidase-4
MIARNPVRATARWLVVVVAVLPLVPVAGVAQDRLRSMPGYERYQAMVLEIPSSVRSGVVQPGQVAWSDDGRAVEYVQAGTRYRFDIAARTRTEVPATSSTQTRARAQRPERGRQFESATSPDDRLRAFHRDRNVWIVPADGGSERRITTDGDERTRVKNGVASWVYGEELNQNTALWWSPDSRRIAYYRFDESKVPDYYLQLGQTSVQSSLDVEAYPKAGVDNPIVELFVHDVAAGTTTKIDVRDGAPFTDDVIGHYVYRVDWSADGSEIRFNRTNRRQNIMEFTACSPTTGKCRVIVREEWLPSWTENSPDVRWLSDGRRFIWVSERNGFRNFYLYDSSGKLLATLTRHPFEVGSIVSVNEQSGTLYYMARSGDNHMKLQLHRVALDGTGDRRLTDPAFHHTISVAPDGRHFIDVAQTHDRPPTTRLLDATGKEVAVLAESDLTRFRELGLHPVELYTFVAADGVTELHGMLHRPSDFDPARKYPVLVSVYGGPATNGARETFTLPNPLTEYGFLVVTLDARSVGGRGKKLLDSIYLNFGVVEIDDIAAGVGALWDRPYVDRERVGIHGSSYGGYASLMALLRHPDVFLAASASSPVTDWKHYDTIYTERYMWTPQENRRGYEAGSALTYVANLRGRLMLYFGTADNNVHPSNSLELIAALQRAGKSFEVQLGPDRGHSGINAERMMEFFIENLILQPLSRPTSEAATRARTPARVP